MKSRHNFEWPNFSSQYFRALCALRLLGILSYCYLCRIIIIFMWNKSMVLRQSRYAVLLCGSVYFNPCTVRVVSNPFPFNMWKSQLLWTKWVFKNQNLQMLGLSKNTTHLKLWIAVARHNFKWVKFLTIYCSAWKVNTTNCIFYICIHHCMVKQNEYECHSTTMITNDVTLQKEKSGFCNHSNVSSIVGLTVSEIKEKNEMNRALGHLCAHIG